MNRNVKLGGLGARILSMALKLFIALIFVFPFYWMFITAFKTFDETILFPPTLWPKRWIYENFINTWNAAPFNIFLKNSIIITLSIVVLQIIIMIPAAFAFAKYNFKYKGLLFGVVLIAFMVPENVTFISVYIMFSKWGILHSLLPQIIPFGANAFGIFLLRQAFMQVPEEIIESAKLDNATTFQIMFRIMVPMSKATMITIALFSFISHWNAYFWPLVMTDQMKYRTIPIAVAMLKNIEGALSWQTIMAGNVILVVPILIVYLFANKQIVKAFVYSGIK
jgi:sn-glycerol 3-phosphate transport system permease protein